VCVVVCAGAGARDGSQPSGAEPLAVTVSILPLKYFVENIGKDKVTVSVMVPPGADPHSFEPKPAQLRDLSRARLFVKAGTSLEFEVAWMPKLISLNKDMRVCDCSQGVALVGEDNSPDPHIWVSLKNAAVIAENVKSALIACDPQDKAYFKSNCRKLKKELIESDRRIAAKLKNYRLRAFLVYHSGWNYFARDYGLREIAIETGGKEPSAKTLSQIITDAKRERITAVFVGPQFSQKSAQVVAREIKAGVVAADNLSENIPEALEKMADSLVSSYER
jgi:zinc transport system substrate-binding protein